MRRVADTWELAVSQTHLAIPALLGVLEERGLELAELKTHSATLEDVFVHLTGRQLRDELVKARGFTMPPRPGLQP